MTKNKTELETYGEEEVVDEVLAAHEADVRSAPKKEKKESALKRLWNATVFPDMIKEAKAKKARKREEKIAMDKLRHEARLEAMQELRPELVKKMKEEEIKKMTGEARKEKMQKFADAFSMGGTGTGGGKDVLGMMGTSNRGGMSNEDIARAMGGGRQTGSSSSHPGGGMSNDDITRAMGGGPGMSNRDITGMATWQDRHYEQPVEPKRKATKKKTKKKSAPIQAPQQRQKTEGELANERLANMLR